MKLYDFELSGNCYKVRLFLSFLQLEWERELVALGTQNKTPEFLALNPVGLVPVLQDGETVLWDSQAILVYLARRYDRSERWLPLDACGLSQVTAWLSLASNEIGAGPAGIRRIHLFGREEDESKGRALTEKVFGVLESRLASHPWLVGDHPTVADVACYPYLALSPDGKFDTSPYPAVLAWFSRIQALPGYLALPGR
ncbi:MAG: glutathione S-transferase family protein [Candidatus Eremiobacteraeota bacterium]|nr:glutathione S-transferase family protein [Candidatus Eremiobacteraeota bacterium]